MVETLQMLIIFCAVTVVTIGLMASMLQYFINREKQSLVATLNAFFEVQDNEEQSRCNLFLDALSKRFSSDITNSIKGNLLGMQSGQARSERALEADIQQDLMAVQQPDIVALLDMFPLAKKRIVRNPALIPIFQSMLSKLGAGRGVSSHGSGNNSSAFSI